jgi:Putative adhesin
MTRRAWLAIGGLALGARGGIAPALQQRSAPIGERWPFAADGSVRIINPSGRIHVIGWDVDSLAVSGRGPGRLAASGTASVRKLVVTGRAELEVQVPRGAQVWVKSVSGDIDVVGVDGTLDLNSVAGAIHVVGTPADVTAETMGGRIELAGGTGRARVKTVSGDILLRGASVDLGASTLSGAIVVRAAGWQRGGTGVQRGKFESVTGDVRFDGELGRGGIVELESQSGAIALRVPATTVADFDLLTIGGSITNRLTADVAPGGGALRFSTGAGGAEVTARSFKGRISLEAQ